MLQGTCPTCGISYYGWALINPDQQECDECGGLLQIAVDKFNLTKKSFLDSLNEYIGDLRKKLFR